MRVLVVGSGGREHVLVWKIKQSRLVDKIFCAPGNGGISDQAECVDIEADDIAGLLEFARKEKMDLTVAGPEAPLAGGIVDEFQNARLKIFGPDKKAARLEGSKIFSKELMKKYNVPTADFRVFDDARQAKRYIDERGGAPCAVKADGLASGKGVVVAKTPQEANQAVVSMMEERVFGDAGKRIIIEDCLEGQEASILIITDSKEIAHLASSQDHKRALDGDQGLNTGGMGAYSPASVVTPDLYREILERVIYRVIHGLSCEGIEYKGVLYVGIMITKDGPKVLEFNVRFGDPETQAILPRLNSDLFEVMLAASSSQLSKITKAGGLSWDSRACVCVVCASGGYPGKYEKGREISGLAEAAALKDITVFHAGTRRIISGGLRAAKFITNGGRVLGVCGLGETIKMAIDKTYAAVGKISFEGMHYRKDIGCRAVL